MSEPKDTPDTPPPAAPAPPRKRKWLRRLRRFAIGLVVFVVVALVAVRLLARTAWLRGKVRGIAETQLGKIIVGGEVHIGAVDGNLLGTMHLRDVAIASPQGPVVVIPDIEVRWTTMDALRAGLGSTTHFERLRLAGLSVHLRQLADGRWELPVMIKPPPPSKGTTVIDQLELTDATVTLEPRGQPARVLSELSFSGRVTTSLIERQIAGGKLALRFGESRVTASVDATLLTGQPPVVRADLHLDGKAVDVRAFAPHLPLMRDFTVDVGVGGKRPPGQVLLAVRMAENGGAIDVRAPVLAPGALLRDLPVTVTLDALDPAGIMGRPQLGQFGLVSGQLVVTVGPPRARPGRRFAVTARLRDLGLPMVPVRRLRASGAFEDGILTLDQLTALGRGAGLRMSGQVDTVRRTHRLRILAAIDELGDVVPRSVGLHGPAEVDAVSMGPNDQATTRAAVRAPGVSMPKIGLFARRFEADARVIGSTLDPALDALVHIGDLATTVMPVDDLDVHVKSYLLRPKAYWTFDGIRARARGRDLLVSQGGSFSVGGLGMRTDQLSLGLLSSHVSLDGTTDWFWNAHARAAVRLELAELRSWFPVQLGKLPLVSGRLSLDDVIVHAAGKRLGALSLAGRISLEHGMLRGIAQPIAAELGVRRDAGRLFADGSVSLAGRRWIEINQLAVPDRLMFDGLHALDHDLGASGALAGQVRFLHGPLVALSPLAPGLAKARGVEAEASLTLGGRAGAPSLDLTALVERPRMGVAPAVAAGLTVVAGAGVTTVNLTGGPDGKGVSLSLIIKSGTGDLVGLAAHPKSSYFAGRLMAAPISGSLSLAAIEAPALLRLQGKLPPPWLTATASGRLTIAGAALAPTVDGRIFIGRVLPGLLARLYVPIDVHASPTRIALESDAAGVFGWPRFLAELTQLPQGPTLVDVARGAPSAISQLHVRLEQAHAVDAKQPARPSIDVTGAIDLGKLAHGVAALDALMMPGRLNADRFDVESLRGFVPSLRELKGVVNGRVELNGIRPFRYGGWLELVNGSMTIRGYGRRYDGLEVSLGFDGETITVNHATVHAGSGALELTGKLSALRRFDGVIALKGFPLIGPAGPNAWIDGSLQLSGSYQHGAVNGRAHFTKARLRLPLESNRDVQSLDALDDVHVVGEAVAPRGLLETMIAEITIATDGLWIVRGQDTRLAVAGEVKAETQHNAAPRLSGQIHALAGDVDILGKSFRIDRGVITLRGTDKTVDPELDLRFSHSELGVETTIFIDVSGRLSKPRVIFRADPPLTEAQVLGLILHGDADWETSETEGSARRRAERTVATIAQAFLRDRVPGARTIKFVPVIEPEEERQSGSSGGRYGVRVPLSDTFIFESTVHTNTTADENTYEGRLQLRLRRRLNVQISGGDAGKGGVDLIWSWRY